jgi:hypothetical protein
MNSPPLASRSLSRRIPPGAGQLAQRVWEGVWGPWRRFWFEPADPTPLAVMRILFGGLLLYTQIVWGLNLEGFLGPHGWQGETLVRTLQADQFAWSFWWWIPISLHVTVHLVCLVILAAFMLGAFTPTTSVLAYLITIAYANRAPMANYGLDQINGMAALYLAIGPSGRVLSIDRLRQRLRAARTQLDVGLDLVIPPVQPSARANLALRLMEVHLCVIYVFACLSKLQGESWWNGLAIWQAVSNLEYQSRDLTWLAWYPWLVNLLTHATIAWEMTFWALVWRPALRPFVLLAGTAIHLGIGAFMGMWTFGLAMIFAYISFLPGQPLAALIRRAMSQLGRLLSRVGVAPGPSASMRLRAVWFALGLEGERTQPVTAETAPSAAAIPATPPIAVAMQSPVETSSTATEISPAPTLDRVAAATPASARRDLPLTRPSILVVEGRLKRQAEVQEYFLKHGFRCHVASELHQARSMLAVIEFDALIVTSSWFPEDELAAFHDGLIGGGTALPASVFLLGVARDQNIPRFPETSRHRVLIGSLSLRELRHLVLEVLGLTEESLRPFVNRRSHSKNGHRSATPERPRLADEELPPETTPDVPSISSGNGSSP